MSNEKTTNPFMALFSTVNDEILKSDAEKSFSLSEENYQSCMQRPCSKEIETIQKILLTTTASSDASHCCCIVLKELDVVSLDCVGTLLFERILFLDSYEGNPQDIMNVAAPNKSSSAETATSDPFQYLYESYLRCDRHRHKQNSYIIDEIEASICETYKTLLIQPDILSTAAPINNLKIFFLQQISYVSSFSTFVAKILLLLAEENWECPQIFKQILDEVRLRLNKCTIRNMDKSMINILQFYASSMYLAKLLLEIPSAISESGQLGEVRNGRIFQSTPLGSLLSISSIPRSDADPYELSSDLSNHETVSITQMIITNLDWLRKEIYNLFLTLLKSTAELKEKLLKWIELCIRCNIGIASSWNLQQSQLPSGHNFVSYGFMMNLCSVMLLLSQPITNNLSHGATKKFNVLKVDPTYCSHAASVKKNLLGYYGAELSQMTTLIPRAEEETDINIPSEYSFVTACFFLIHRVLNLCVTIVDHEMRNTSQQHRHLQQQLTVAPPQIRDRIRELITKISSKYIAIVIAFFNERSAETLGDFCSATSLWLPQIALFPQNDRQSLIPKAINTDVLEEIDIKNNTLLANIPEAIIENVVTSINLSKKSKKNIVVNCSKERMDQYYTLIACFMGSPNLTSNPHLRAQMAETLCSLISRDSETANMSSIVEVSVNDYYLSSRLVSALIHVFVSIEVTGSTVAFEEKFNYRRPMYDVINIMWSLPKLRRNFVLLAKDALLHMESAQAPLFLRFVNLLINDAIFLLDEGLSYMVQLKQHVAQRENADWENMSSAQLASRSNNLNQMSMLAEFHNTLATLTIETIIKITGEISLMFAHTTLVDRIAAMLNHFLQQLVGPKRTDFKVRDMEKYKFRPADIVANICTIYFNLYQHDSFVMAVIGDGRSYNSLLFSQAITVLERTGNFQLSTDIRKVEKVIREAGIKHKLDEDLSASAPDQFIDPIMIQVMNDPVLLPSSNVIVDRSTIARHLLSDQSDPFNRQPLTMEDVIPCIELKEKIQNWRKKSSDNKKEPT